MQCAYRCPWFVSACVEHAFLAIKSTKHRPDRDKARPTRDKARAKATARLRAGARRQVRASIGTAAPCFTAYNVKSRIAACSNHLKSPHGFCRQVFSQLFFCDSQQYVRAIITRGMCMEVACTKFFVVNGISILSL